MADPWHARALAGEPQPLHEDEPHEGWYLMRCVKDGPWVPVEIVDGGLGLSARILHEAPVSAVSVWTRCAHKPITQEEYTYRRTEYDWLLAHHPDDPRVRYREPVDLSRASLPEF